jgi:hypothetical protein
VIIVDTSGVLAAIDPQQAHHAASAQALRQPQRRILSPFVLAELDYLIGTHGGLNEALKLLREVSRGVYELEAFSRQDMAAAIAIIEQYADLNLGITDASVIVLAKRHRCPDILTLDQRHFRAVTGLDGKPFRLLPHDAG